MTATDGCGGATDESHSSTSVPHFHYTHSQPATYVAGLGGGEVASIDMRNNAKGKWVDEWMACGDGARGDTLGEVFKDVDTGSLVNAHDTAVPLLRHAPTHLESAHSRFSCHSGAGRKENQYTPQRLNQQPIQ